MSNRPPIKIAIIGGGPAGVSLCIQLTQALEQLPHVPLVSILLFESKSAVGVGLPYGSYEDSFCINLPKNYMYLRPGQYHHFSEWTQVTKNHYAPFPPRHYFGEYAQEQLATIKPSMKYTLCIYNEYLVEDIALPSHAAGYHIKAKHKNVLTHIEVDFIILATGHLPNTTYADLQGENCSLNPWDLNFYSKVNPNNRIGIIGSRLTAIDVTLKLINQKHQGTINMFSRTGLLSSVRGDHCPPTMRHLTPKNIQRLIKQTDPITRLPELIKLFEKEIKPFLGRQKTLDDTIKKFNALSPLARLTQEVKQAELKRTGWQSVLSCFYQILYNLWTGLTPSAQNQFLRKYRGVLLTFLCSFPLEKARLLLERMQEGQLFIYGGLADIRKKNSIFRLDMENKPSLNCDSLILALGSGCQPEATPLLAKMLNNSLIMKHPNGGLAINTTSYQTLTNYQNESHIYALGDLVKGACFNTVELGQMVQQGQIITQHLIKVLSNFHNEGPVHSIT